MQTIWATHLIIWPWLFTLLLLIIEMLMPPPPPMTTTLFVLCFFPVQIVSFSSRLKFLILFFIMYPTYPHGNLRKSLAVLIEALCQPSMWSIYSPIGTLSSTWLPIYDVNSFDVFYIVFFLYRLPRRYTVYFEQLSAWVYKTVEWTTWTQI